MFAALVPSFRHTTRCPRSYLGTQPFVVGTALAIAVAAASCAKHHVAPPPPAAAPAPISEPPQDAAPIDVAEAGSIEDALAQDVVDATEDAPGERWTDAHRSADECHDYTMAKWAEVYADPNGPDRKYGYDGYVFRRVAVRRTIDGVERLHCVRVYYPPKDRSAAGKPVRISQLIGPPWYRLIENTLSRLPWLHLQVVRAIVIDNRPILHGVASFSRNDPEKDARDGHTIWLNQRLFTQVNGWGPGNYGKYWAYRVNRDRVHAHGQPADHELFSPVLIHEVGHLANYHVVNGSGADPTCPMCAWMCGDHDNCKDLKPEQKEAYCATAYCTGFGYASGTENFAEMYRWYYQGGETRALLEKHFEPCFRLLQELNGRWEPPWKVEPGEAGGEEGEYRKTVWESCAGRPCRAY